MSGAQMSLLGGSTVLWIGTVTCGEWTNGNDYNRGFVTALGIGSYTVSLGPNLIYASSSTYDSGETYTDGIRFASQLANAPSNIYVLFGANPVTRFYYIGSDIYYSVDATGTFFPASGTYNLVIRA